MKECSACKRFIPTNDYCPYCGLNTLFSRSGLLLEKDEGIVCICRVSEGIATVPIKDQRSFDIVAAHILRLFTYIGGSIYSPRTHSITLFGELAVTSKRLIFINELGFFFSKPLPVLFVPLSTIVAIGVKSSKLPLFPFSDKGLLITYKVDGELCHIELSTDLDPNWIKSRIEQQISRLKPSKQESA